MAYHPQTQGLVERMNQTMAQTLRCTLHHLGNQGDWKSILPTVEFAINSLPNRSTGYSPFYLNYGYHPVIPSELIKGDEVIRNEAVSQFTGRMTDVWETAKGNLEKAIQQQKKFYDRHHRAIEIPMNSSVLLSTANLPFRNVPRKLRRRFVGPFRVIERIGKLAYRLELPDSWKIHDVFHISLLKPWTQSRYSVAQEAAIPELDLQEPEYFEYEKVLRWRKVGRGSNAHKEYLVLWKDRPLDEMSWIPEAYFQYPEALRARIQLDKPVEEPSSSA